MAELVDGGAATGMAEPDIAPSIGALPPVT